MDALSAAQTLELWEACEDLPPLQRSLALAAGGSGVPMAELVALPLGRRDAWVLELYGALGGATLEATVPCPSCGEQNEFAIEPAALLARARECAEVAPLRAEGYVLAWRALDSRDFAAAAEQREADAGECLLLSRCVLEATGPDGEELSGAALPREVRGALAAAMLAADPLAEVLVAVCCSACETAFTADLDVSAFVWSWLRARGQRLLREVHALASAYGWSEPEVLALDERRRRAYLELVEQVTG